MKKIIVPVLTVIWVLMFSLTACENSSGGVPRGSGTNDDPTHLPQQNFKTALEAYNFGKRYFEETAEHYESIYYGSAVPQGLAAGLFAGEQKVYTHRYLSSNGDYMYDSANYSTKGFDVSFSFIAAKRGEEGDMRYKKIDGKGLITQTDDALYSDYSDYDLSKLNSATMAEFKDICGLNPRELLNYIITEDTISSVEYFNKGEEGDEFAYSFKFKLKSSAHENYKKQVAYYSGHDYQKFSYLNLEFGMDKYGRILQITTSEEYSVAVLGSQKSKVDGTQYISYGKNPIINFDGFTVSYNN